MRREETAARTRMIPSTAALVSSAQGIKTSNGYFEEKPQFEVKHGALTAKRESRSLFQLLL